MINGTNGWGDCSKGGLFKISLDDPQIEALQKLAWVNGTGTGPLIKPKSPPPAGRPPLTEDDIYGTVSSYPPGRDPQSILANSMLKNGAEGALAGAVHKAVALVLAVVLALVLNA